ncbi:MAG: serine/threonine protein kinase, partial [Gammaproteobacteria bacterium]|nr:serine/threonine protein kinase [Gammaproteobacteria bacterium]
MKTDPWGLTMIRKYAFIASTSLAVLAGCGGSGDIEINPSTTDNSVTNSNNTTTTTAPQQTVNPCASYVTSGGQTRQGTYGDDGNCVYSPLFADSGNNITVDVDFAALPDGGAHIFEGSLFIGEAYSSTAEMNAAGIFEGGDGPTMTVEAGATLAWQSNDKFMVINRGSQLVAIGTATAPITFTSVSDVNGTVGPED